MEKVINEARKLLDINKPLQADNLLRQALKEYGNEYLGQYASQLYAMRGECAFQMSNMDNAVKSYWFAAQTEKILRRQLEYYSNYLFCLHYSNRFTPEEIYQYAEMGSRLFGAVEYYSDYQPVEGKIKIAYLSADLREHAMGNFLMPFFKEFNQEKFEVHVYCLNDHDMLTEKFAECPVIWHDCVNVVPGELAEKIHDDGINILVDLCGHTHGGIGLLVMAYRPAPIQITALGWLSTTGCDFVDYYLTDEECSRDFAHLFTEKLLCLNTSFLCFSPQSKYPELAWKRKEYITFGAFSNFDKITDEQLLLWQEILQKKSGAKLILKDTTTIPSRKLALEERINKFGIENVTVEMASDDYLTKYNSIDIALDTYPYAGGATLCEALYMGVPVICRRGNSHSRNIAASILYYAEHDELLADDEKDYVKKAVQLANNITMIEKYHLNLREDLKKSSLMNSNKYVKNLEKKYEKCIKDLSL